jgi:hypothetical protein
MSVEAILAQLAQQAGQRRESILGGAIAGVSQLPGQILDDRERRRVQQLQEARQAEQLAFQRNADTRATADQAAQDRAVALKQHEQMAMDAVLTAYHQGTPNDPTTNNLTAGILEARKQGMPHLEDVLKEMDQKEQVRARGTITTHDPKDDVYRDNVLVKPGVQPLKTTTNDLALLAQNSNPFVATLADKALTRAQRPAETHSPIYKEWQDYQKTGGPLGFDAYMTADANRKKPVVNIGGLTGLYNATDPKAIAAQIRAGQMPPDIGQYGRPVQGAIASVLAQKGPNGEAPFNLASAQREWKAQLKLNSTMNGPQQVRLDESIRSGLAMYDKVDQIAEEWNGLGIGPLSRANLAAARDGLKGKAAATIANQLTGQIGQLTSDIATIEQGGLTPTNEARAVAEQSMQAWWGKGTINDMTAQGRYNMQIRHTARNTQEPMAPGNGVDTRSALPATPAAAAPAGMMRVVGPNGETGSMPVGNALPPGWKKQ